MAEMSNPESLVTLHPYQIVGSEWLASRHAALLADDMGLGKSAQAIRACDDLLAHTVLVVCPASVVENWRREFAKFSVLGTVPAVYSYDAITRGTAKLLHHYGVLILDEAHYLKSRDAKRTQAIFGEKCDGEGGLAERAEYVFALTGTPMPNHPAELWPMLRALAPETITGKSGRPMHYWPFVTSYCTTRDNGFGIQITGGKRHEVLKEKLAPFMLRRLKSEVLTDLPPITWGELFVEGKIEGAGGRAEAVGYMEEVNKVCSILEKKGVDGLREIAPHVATLRRLTGLAKVAPVVEWVKEWLESTDRKIVLMAHHREVIEGLFDGLWGDGRFMSTMDLPAVVTGSTPAHLRQAGIDRFQNEPNCRVFIGQIQAAGVGITLTAASDVLFVESSWVPAENSQAAMRVHRIGQGNPCLIRFATLAGSIDEQIQKAVARKTADITKILG
jgi:SWI/SNF-related matrix-associated actin-dependent regulator 1 of chromatin subfamily A